MDAASRPAPGLARALLKSALLVALVAAGALGARALGLDAIDPARARGWVLARGAWSLVAAVPLYALLVAVAVPGAPLTLACGYAFGFERGSLVALLEANLGANAAYVLGRGLGREGVARLLGPRLARVEAALREGGGEVVVTLRLIPFVPFSAVNYACGVVPGLRWRAFALGTAIGIVPGTLAYVALGEFPDPRRPAFWGLVVGIQLLAALPIGLRAIRRRISVVSART